MKKYFRQFFVIILLVIVLILPCLVFAGNDIETNLKNLGSAGGYDTSGGDTQISEMAGTIVSAALGLLGVVFIILFIFGGYKWMMARGNEQDVEESKDIMKNAVIGLIIVVGAYAIWSFILLSVLTK